MNRFILPLGAALTLCLASGTRGEDWPQWRGPFFNGSTTENGLPTEWSRTERVAWAAPLPGYSGATPVIWQDSVFVSSADAEKHLLLLCLERKTGQVRWQKVVATGDRAKGRNNMASPSPATDGKRVIVLFGTGDLAAFDFSGQELWTRNLAKDYGHFANQWIYASSPMLDHGKLFVQVLQRNPCPARYTDGADEKPERESFLLCLEPETGRNLWRQVRPTDAVDESQEAYSTPIPFAGPNGPEILVVGGDYLTAHSPENGEELWRCAGLNLRKQRSWRIVPSPVAVGDMVIACAPKRDPVLAVRDGGHGTVTETRVAWQFRESPSDCATPLAYQNKLFVLDGDRQTMTCLDPRSGQVQWQGKLGGREIFRASPSGADGKIYCVDEAGTVVVLDAGPEFKLLSSIPMGEGPVRSSIAVAHRQLFLRTAEHLYCIGER